MRASRTATNLGCASGRTAGPVLANQKSVVVLGGGEAAEIYATQISRNFVRINAQIRMLQKECETAARLLQDVK